MNFTLKKEWHNSLVEKSELLTLYWSDLFTLNELGGIRVTLVKSANFAHELNITQLLTLFDKVLYYSLSCRL